MESQKNNFKFVLKDGRKFSSVPGTKFISIKDQLILSSGVLSLNSLLGGGLQLGSVLLIEEDEFGVFSKYLTKYFLAEGVASKHCLFVSSLDCNVHQLVYELPSPVDYCEPVDNSQSVSDLKIAWRYQDTPVVQSAPSSQNTFGHNFDLTSLYSKEAIDNTEIAYWPLNEDYEDPYTSLLTDLQDRIKKQGHSIHSVQSRRTVLRAAVHCLGSPLWPQPSRHLPRFLYHLRHLIHSANATAVVTLPTAFHQATLVDQCEHLCDNVIRLQSLANDANPLYSEYSGLLTVIKLATLHSPASHVPDTLDWAFKLRKKRFIVEKLHLPPELQDSQQREQDENSSLACASARNVTLDF